MWDRKKKYDQAKQALFKALTYHYRDRKVRKRDKRSEWQVQINAAARINGLSYSKFIGGLKRAKIELDRKILAQLARTQPETFAKIVAKAK